MMSSRKVAMPFCRHQLGIYVCIVCANEFVQQDTANYPRASASPSISYLENANENAFVHCGSHFQSPDCTNQKNRNANQRQNKSKTSRSRRLEQQRNNRDSTLHNSHAGPNSLSYTSGQSSSQHSSPLPQQLSPRSVHHQTPPLQQYTENASLPFPNHSQTSNARLPRVYCPPPVTHCYQLDRFLDEIPDFRSAALSGNLGCLTGRRKGIERSRKHCHALRVRVRNLQGSIEGL
ncbi:hypothetical protein F5882DRAFT_158593 [Hyaloscypha sp. PMI_1271]|nr:hypothetical protein F5882DRAFT_158593 [Hyaloscypha sp. PMI_1271]